MMLRHAVNAFQRVLEQEAAADTRLGCPSSNFGHFARRMTAMERMTGGRGFRVPKAAPRTDTQGKTRGQRRRETYARLFLGA